MALIKAALKKLSKEENIKTTLDYQNNFNQGLKSMKKDLSELKKSFPKHDATKQVNSILRDQTAQIERRS